VALNQLTVKKYQFLYLLLLFPITLSAQTRKVTPSTYIHDKGGLVYKIYVNKGGLRVQQGDFISISAILKTDGDSVLLNTYATGSPLQTIVPKPQFNGDIFSGLMKLGEGDSAVFKINADTMFKKLIKPPGFKGDYLNYYVKVNKVIKKGTLTSEEFSTKVTAFEKIRTNHLKLLEPVLISKYITLSKLQFNKTADTLYYDIVKQGDGPVLKPGDTAEVNYTGRFLDGKIFDTSIKEIAISGKISVDPKRIYAPISIPVGKKRVIAGWDEGLQLLNKGAKAVFIVPSSLAYGERGMSVIQPYTPIEFEIEVVDIKH
jgi:FKBP-type peptidyl-prolyl cis-trans isomerase FkpA